MKYKKSSQTERKIIESFAKLINKKGKAENIKVKDILEEANVSKTTFYNYFKDINAIVNKISKTLESSFFSEIDNIFKTGAKNLKENITSLVNELIKYEKIIKLGIKGINVPLIINNFKDKVKAKITNKINEYQLHVSAQKLIKLSLVLNGSFDVILDSLKNSTIVNYDEVVDVIIKEMMTIQIFNQIS